MKPTEQRFALPGAVSGGTIRGIVARPPSAGPYPLAVIAHGYSVSCEWGFFPALASRLARRGIASVRFAFSGDGFGEDLRTVVDLDVVGRNTYVDEVEDFASVRAFADTQSDLDSGRAVLVGHSRGGGMGIVHAAEDGRYRTVVGWAPLDRILQFAGERIARWRREGELLVRHHTLREPVRLERSVLDDAERNRARLDIEAAVRRLTCPLLVISGGRDSSIPPSAGARLLAASPSAGSRHVVIEDAGHTFGARDPLPEPLPARLEQLLAITVDWVADHTISSSR